MPVLVGSAVVPSPDQVPNAKFFEDTPDTPQVVDLGEKPWSPGTNIWYILEGPTGRRPVEEALELLGGHGTNPLCLRTLAPKGPGPG